MNRIVWDVILHNEGEGTPIFYDVYAESHYAAICEAWRQYRELSYFDGEYPPEWARPIVQIATNRPNGERPWLVGDTIFNLSDEAIIYGPDGEFQGYWGGRESESA